MWSSALFWRTNIVYILSFLLLAEAQTVPGGTLFNGNGATGAGAYELVDDYEPSIFFEKFSFSVGNFGSPCELLTVADRNKQLEQTYGHVQYVTESVAVQNGYVSSSASSARIGVDTTNQWPRGGLGRPSVKIISDNTYTHGLFVLDLAHMPWGCGTWPAYWLVGPNWPYTGEIDIIEGVNTLDSNTMSLHTSPGCTIAGSGRTAEPGGNNCDTSAGNGCGSVFNNTLTPNNYGDDLNNAGGGVYATEWTSDYIKTWFFPRGSIPPSITSGAPDVSTFGVPAVNAQGDCEIDAHFSNMSFIINIDMCGAWAGEVYEYEFPNCPQNSSETSGDTSLNSCVDFVGLNPTYFDDAYWEINSLKVYQMPPGAVPSSAYSTSLSSVTPMSSANTVVMGMGASSATGSAPVYTGPLSSATTTMSAVSSAGTPAICPGYNNTVWTDSMNQQYRIACGSDYQGGGISQSASSFEKCMEICDGVNGCTAVSFVGGNGAGICYVKSNQGNFLYDGSTNAAARVAGPASVASSSSTSSMISTQSIGGYAGVSSTQSSASSSTARSSTSSSTVLSTTSSSSHTAVSSSPTSSTSPSSSAAASSSSTVVTSSSTSSSTSLLRSSSSSSSSSSSPTRSSTTSTSSYWVWSSYTASSTDTPLSSSSSLPTSSAMSSSSSSPLIMSTTASSSLAQNFSASSTSTSSTASVTAAGYVPTPACNSTYIEPSTGNAWSIHCSTDTSDGSFQTVTVSSGGFGACFAICDATQDCQGFTFEGSDSGYCYLKSAYGSFIAASSSVTTCFKTSIYGSAPPVAPMAPTPSLASNSNYTIRSTGAWSAAPGSYSTASATSGTSTANPVPTFASVSYAPPCPTSTSDLCSSLGDTCASSSGAVYGISCGLAYEGTVLNPSSSKHKRQTPEATFQACSSLCDSTTGCVALNYIGTSCTLFSSVTGTYAAPGAVGASQVTPPTSSAAPSATPYVTAPSSTATASNSSGATVYVLPTTTAIPTVPPGGYFTTAPNSGSMSASITGAGNGSVSLCYTCALTPTVVTGGDSGTSGTTNGYAGTCKPTPGTGTTTVFTTSTITGCGLEPTCPASGYLFGGGATQSGQVVVTTTGKSGGTVTYTQIPTSTASRGS